MKQTEEKFNLFLQISTFLTQAHRGLVISSRLHRQGRKQDLPPLRPAQLFESQSGLSVLSVPKMGKEQLSPFSGIVS